MEHVHYGMKVHNITNNMLLKFKMNRLIYHFNLYFVTEHGETKGSASIEAKTNVCITLFPLGNLTPFNKVKPYYKKLYPKFKETTILYLHSIPGIVSCR